MEGIYCVGEYHECVHVSAVVDVLLGPWCWWWAAEDSWIEFVDEAENLAGEDVWDVTPPDPAAEGLHHK